MSAPAHRSWSAASSSLEKLDDLHDALVAARVAALLVVIGALSALHEVVARPYECVGPAGAIRRLEESRGRTRRAEGGTVDTQLVTNGSIALRAWLADDIPHIRLRMAAGA